MIEENNYTNEDYIKILQIALRNCCDDYVFYTKGRMFLDVNSQFEYDRRIEDAKQKYKKQKGVNL